IKSSCFMRSGSEFRQFHEQLLFSVRERSRELYRPCHVKITKVFLLIPGKALPLQPNAGAGLRAGRNAHLDLASEAIQRHLTSQHGCVQVDFPVYIQIRTIPFEYRVFEDVKGDIEVAVWSTVYTRASVTADLDGLPIFDTSWYSDAYFFAIDIQRLFMRFRRLAKAQRQRGVKVLTTKTGCASKAAGSATSKKELEEIGKAAVIKATRERLLPCEPSSPAGPRTFEGLCVFPILAVLVVLLSFLRIAEHLVGFIDLLKLGLSFFVVGV